MSDTERDVSVRSRLAWGVAVVVVCIVWTILTGYGWTSRPLFLGLALAPAVLVVFRPSGARWQLNRYVLPAFGSAFLAPTLTVLAITVAQLVETLDERGAIAELIELAAEERAPEDMRLHLGLGIEERDFFREIAGATRVQPASVSYRYGVRDYEIETEGGVGYSVRPQRDGLWGPWVVTVMQRRGAAAEASR